MGTPREEPLRGVRNLGEFETLAKDVLDPPTFDYIAGGSGEEITLAENVEAFRRRRLRPRVLVDVSTIDLSTEVLGTPLAMPVGVAPMASQHHTHVDGEPALARAAAAAGAMFCLSTGSGFSLEDVAAASGGGPRWFQLYVHEDRARSEELVRRAEACGYGAIVLTVDLPVAGYRERDVRSGFVDSRTFGNFAAAEADGSDTIATAIAAMNDRTLSWADIAWLRGLTSLPIVIKGVMTGEDAARAVIHGASGVWVSNHGGRQLDRTQATIDVLDEVVNAVGGRAEVYLDSGVRRGADVVIALAMGAQAVFIGKPMAFALATGGEAGVSRAFEILRTEVETTMALMGVTRIGRLARRMVVP